MKYLISLLSALIFSLVLFLFFSIEEIAEALFLKETIKPTLHSTNANPIIQAYYPPPQKIKQSPEVEKECHIPADLSMLPKEVFLELKKNIADIPCPLVQSLRSIEVFDDPFAPRAMAGRTILKIRNDVVYEDNLGKILFHELGHIVDLGGIQGTPESGESLFWDGSIPIYKNDISLIFYQISWKDSIKKKNGISDMDFVSGYASTDPFEDFAESFLYYREHGKEFRLLAEHNSLLAEKYEFFRKHVFNGKEFSTGKDYVELKIRPWDTTNFY